MNTKKNVITDEQIEELYAKLRPVVTVDGVKFLLKKYTLEEIKNKAFLTSKKEDKESFIENSKIEVKGVFDYIKEYKNPLSFNPTIEDILAYIPKSYMEDADAFEIAETPRVSGNNHITKLMTYKLHK